MAETIWKMIVPSTALLEEAKFSILLGRKCSLEYSYEGAEEFSVIVEKLVFDGVESFKCTYYKACLLEMIEAYDKVVDVGNSTWLNKIRQNLSEYEADATNLKHLRIYFDDGPCYELICRSFEVVNEAQKEYFGNHNNPV